MSTLFYSMTRSAIPDDLDNVRSTVTRVVDDAPSMQEHAPEVNEIVTDPLTDGGLTGHALASKVTPSVRYAPANTDKDGTQFNASVNAQVSSSGTAAAREAAGRWGHGTILKVEGIEPVLGDGRPGFGDTYFKAGHDHVAQDGAGKFMSAGPNSDPQTVAGSAATAARAAREAQRGLYAAMYNGRMGL